VPTGFEALDRELPGGGWPRRVLTEWLLPHPGVGEIRLLSACLVAIQQAGAW
jgi:protein ImuA